MGRSGASMAAGGSRANLLILWSRKFREVPFFLKKAAISACDSLCTFRRFALAALASGDGGFGLVICFALAFGGSLVPFLLAFG
jgi:hypothetical protein